MSELAFVAGLLKGSRFFCLYGLVSACYLVTMAATSPLHPLLRIWEQ